MEADSQGDSRLHLQVKNTFLDFQTDEDGDAGIEGCSADRSCKISMIDRGLAQLQ